MAVNRHVTMERLRNSTLQQRKIKKSLLNTNVLNHSYYVVKMILSFTKNLEHTLNTKRVSLDNLSHYSLKMGFMRKSILAMIF